MTEPSTASAAGSSASIERAGRLAAEEESLERKLLRVRIVAGLATFVLVVSCLVYAGIVVSAMFILNGGGGELPVFVLAGVTLLQAIIVGPCLWARRWPARIRARMDHVVFLQRQR